MKKSKTLPDNRYQQLGIFTFCIVEEINFGGQRSSQFKTLQHKCSILRIANIGIKHVFLSIKSAEP